MKFFANVFFEIEADNASVGEAETPESSFQIVN